MSSGRLVLEASGPWLARKAAESGGEHGPLTLGLRDRG